MVASFSECVRAQVVRYGEDRSYTFLNGAQGEGVGASQVLSYLALDEAGSRIASKLSSLGLAHQPVLLLYPPGLEFIKAFVACLYAQVIAVPAPLPNDPRSFGRLAGIVINAGIHTVLTTAALADGLRARLGEKIPREVDFIATDANMSALDDGWQLPDIAGHDIAFLQFTSGSTSEPKGVVVTHGNLLHNQEQIAKVALGGDEGTVVGWLPHFHDMGLIGMLLHPLYVGCNCVFMAPATFLKRPIRWLDAISRYKASITVAPDFAYELCARG